MSVNVMRIREVFADNDEIASWIDQSSYEGAETYTHLVGLYETALAAADEIESLTEALERIKAWADAYPLHMFPEPDWGKVKDALESNGLSLGAVSASNMRHVITGISGIVNEALKENSDE